MITNRQQTKLKNDIFISLKLEFKLQNIVQNCLYRYSETLQRDSFSLAY